MLRKLKPKSEFSRNVLTLMTGTTIAQAIPIALTPILTRIYTPDDFGVFALYISIATLISVIATGRYELAIMLPKKDSDAMHIVVLSMVLAFIVSFLTFIFIVIFKESIVTLVNNNAIGNWLYLMPVTILFTGLYQSFNYWSNRKKQYKRLAVSRIVQSSSTVATKLGMGFSGLTSSGLIIGAVFGQAFSTVVLGKMIWKEDKNIFKGIEKKKFLALMRRYKKMPIFNLPNALIDGIRNTGLRLLLAKYFSNAILGQFALAWNMLQLPMSLIGGSLSQVFYQKLSNVKHGDMTNVILKFIMKAALIPLVPFIVLYFYSELLFGFVFGEQWLMAGKISAMLIPWVYMNFITSPISTIFIIHNKQEMLLVFAIIYMLVPLLIIYIFHNEGVTFIIQSVSNAMALLLLGFLGMSLYVAKDFDKQITKEIS